MMHIITGIWSRHFLHMLTGKRYPSQVKSRKKNTAVENKVLAQDAKACVKLLDSWALDKVRLACAFPNYLFTWTCVCICRHKLGFC